MVINSPKSPPSQIHNIFSWNILVIDYSKNNKEATSKNAQVPGFLPHATRTAFLLLCSNAITKLNEKDMSFSFKHKVVL